MTNLKDDYPAEARSFRVDRAAVITVRMPTADERDSGYPEGEPVMVVSDGAKSTVFPCWMSLTVDDPHVAPKPDAARDAVAYVLGVIGEQLHLAGARVADLTGAVRRSPCEVAHLAADVRESEDAAWGCADATMCDLARPAVSAT
jgi:hypothetical protein